MIVSSFAFWLATYNKNASDFMTMAFVFRFLFGFGAGLLRSVITIARAQSKRGNKEMQVSDYFKWHMQAEAFGYFLGPLIIALTSLSSTEVARSTMWLAIVTAIIWFVFTVCFVDYSSPLNDSDHLRAFFGHNRADAPTSDGGSDRHGVTK